MNTFKIHLILTEEFISNKPVKLEDRKKLTDV